MEYEDTNIIEEIETGHWEPLVAGGICVALTGLTGLAGYCIGGIIFGLLA